MCFQAGEAGQIIQHAGFGIELFVLILGEVVEIDVVAKGEFAFCDGLDAGEEFDESGFACAVELGAIAAGGPGLFEFFDAALDLLGFGGLGAETVDEGFESFDVFAQPEE